MIYLRRCDVSVTHVVETAKWLIRKPCCHYRIIPLGGKVSTYLITWVLLPKGCTIYCRQKQHCFMLQPDTNYFLSYSLLKIKTQLLHYSVMFWQHVRSINSKLINSCILIVAKPNQQHTLRTNKRFAAHTLLTSIWRSCVATHFVCNVTFFFVLVQPELSRTSVSVLASRWNMQLNHVFSGIQLHINFMFAAVCF